jgi:pimeloyl-ACP methyl ester carboxylesterase
MELPEPDGLIHSHQPIETDIDLHIVERTGTGTPVVLLHGIWGSWRAWLPVLTLDPDPFGGRPVFIVDLRGHGDSGKPARGYGLRDYAGDVAALIREFDQPVILGGHSLGALVALTAAPSVVDQIAVMVLEEPPLPLPTRAGNLDTAWSNFAEAIAGLSMLKHEPLPVIVEQLMTNDPELLRADAEEAAVALSLTADGVFSTIMMGEFGGNEDALPAKPLDLPALVFQGELEDERMLGDIGVAMLRGALSRPEMCRLSGSGHSIHHAQPAAFGSEVARFLDASLTRR